MRVRSWSLVQGRPWGLTQGHPWGLAQDPAGLARDRPRPHPRSSGDSPKIPQGLAWDHPRPHARLLPASLKAPYSHEVVGCALRLRGLLRPRARRSMAARPHVRSLAAAERLVQPRVRSSTVAGNLTRGIAVMYRCSCHASILNNELHNRYNMVF